MAVQDYKINYKSDFVLNINGDAGWAVPFCIKFWTGMPSQAYFVGFDGVKYVNCRVGDTPTQLLVMFDDHHLPIGPLKMQIAYHTTIEEFPGSVFDEVTNARDVIVTIDGTDYQVLLDFTGEDAPELEFDLPAYANEAERIQNEFQRQQNEADRIAAELQREQATAAAVQGAENVNAQLNGTTLTVTNRLGVSTSVNTKGERGERGPVGPEGPQGEQGVSIVDFSQKSQTETALIYTATFSDGHTQDVAIPKGPKGDTGATGPTGPQGPQGDTGVSITGLVKTGETETDTLYNVTFSNGTTQAVSIPKGEKGDQGEQGPEGPQGPMGDVAVITPEQQAAFTMYSVPGQNTNGPMTQKAVTDSIVVESMDGQDSDLDLADEAGFVIARFRSGFDSDVCPSQESEENSELDIADKNGNVIVRFANGHIYTKLFDSSQSGGGGSSSKKSIKILFLGNSVTQDHATYLPWLLKNTYGVENIEFAISIFYCGGSFGTIKEYATTIADGGRNAEIFSSVVNTDVWTNETDISLDTALARQAWDVISIQGWANGTNEDVTYIPTLIEKLVAKMNHPFELAYLINQTPSAKPTVLINTAKQVCRDYSISMLFPPALVTEYARQAWGTEFISPDGGHNREGLPCIMTAYSIMLTLCRRLGLWDAVIGNELRATAAEIERMRIPGQNGSLVATTDAQYLQAQEFAVKAVNAADAIFNEAKANCLNNLMS